MTRVFLTVSIVLATALLAAAPASAQRCQAPPGTAAVDQYCENVPSASGDGGEGGGGATSAKPSQGTVRAIEQAEGGEELNRYLGEGIASTRGSRERSTKESSGKNSPERDSAAAAPKQPSSSPLGAVQSAVNSGNTVGDAFVWILIAIALLIGGTAWLRYRRRSTSS